MTDEADDRQDAVGFLLVLCEAADAEIPPDQALHIIHSFLAIQFPLLHPAEPSPATPST